MTGETRLKELRQKIEAFRLPGLNDGDEGGEDFVSIDMQLAERQDGMARLLQQIQTLKKDVENIKQTHHSEVLYTMILDKKNKQELDSFVSQVKTSSQVIRSKLQDIEREIDEEKDELEDELAPASHRINKTPHSSVLLRDFVNVMNEFQIAQVEYRDRCKRRIKRQLDITGANFTDEQVERMVEEGNFSVFTQSILMETEEARQMFADVDARQTQILKLERSLRELHDLFLEFPLLVEESQGESLDRIENKNLSADCTEITRGQLKQTKATARKKTIWIVIFLTLVVFLLLLITYVFI